MRGVIPPLRQVFIERRFIKHGDNFNETCVVTKQLLVTLLLSLTLILYCQLWGVVQMKPVRQGLR
jgi:hypothetical protein